MNGDDLKRYTPIVGAGSGCFFQPMTQDYTYILTSRHLFCDGQNIHGVTHFVERPDGQIIQITRQVHDGTTWSPETTSLTLTRGENYFPHGDTSIDAAILKVGHIESVDQILIHNDPASIQGYTLSGYPANRRNLPEAYTSYVVDRSIASANFGQTAQLVLGNITQDNIEGMSGGGIFRADPGAILVAGIQSKILSVMLPAGQVGFVPMSRYLEIVEQNDDKLERLLPLYLKSFKYIQDEIFKIEFGVEEQQVAERLTVLLKGQAARIIESDITPTAIREHLKERLMLILPKQSVTDLEKKQIWIAWLELMTILNITYNQTYNAQDLPNLLKKLRLFYSDTEHDFFIAHLDDLDKLDYTGLEKGGVVVVASNGRAKGKAHILRPDRIPKIDAMRSQHQLAGLAIDNPTEYPLDKYKFFNISAFKEGCIVDQHEIYQKLEVAQYLTNLRTQYEQLFG